MLRLGFPNPVNEKAARVVAAAVALTGAVALVTRWWWLAAALAVGFLARVLAGPRWSIVGRLATRVIAPRLGPPRWVPGPPKRFAQGIGLVVTTVAALSALVLDAAPVAAGLLAMLVALATLEAVVGFCTGCWLFARLMTLGVIPGRVCEACSLG